MNILGEFLVNLIDTAGVSSYSENLEELYKEKGEKSSIKGEVLSLLKIYFLLVLISLMNMYLYSFDTNILIVALVFPAATVGLIILVKVLRQKNK